ncbi:MAG: DMT family transporter [Acidimicrobiales bacterium]|jgi:drug/metabolite transporter (DMT)-like permease
MSILFALLGAFSQALTSVLQRLANVAGSGERRSMWETTKFLIRQPIWLLGMVCMGGTFIFTALALYFGTLASVQPILVTELIFTLALRVFWLRDRIATRTWGAAGLLCAGLFGFLVVAHPQEGHHRPTAAAWIVALGSRGLLVVVLLVLSRWGSPARRAALLGAAAALVWAVDAAFVKAATEVLAHEGWSGLFEHWPVYAVVASGVLGTVLLESAFAVGPLAASQSALLIVDPLASIAIGIELFGEQLRNSPGAIVLQVVFLGALFTGVVLLSRWAPPEMEARAKRSPRVVPAGGPGGDPGPGVLTDPA